MNTLDGIYHAVMCRTYDVSVNDGQKAEAILKTHEIFINGVVYY
jgi:hypothetical protein